MTVTGVRPYSRAPVWATVAAEALRHQLEAVAHAEDGDAGREDRGVDAPARPRRTPTTGRRTG